MVKGEPSPIHANTELALLSSLIVHLSACIPSQSNLQCCTRALHLQVAVACVKGSEARCSFMLAFSGSQHILSISLHLSSTISTTEISVDFKHNITYYQVTNSSRLAINCTVFCLKIVLIVVIETWTPKGSSSLLQMKRLALQFCLVPHDRSIEISIYLHCVLVKGHEQLLILRCYQKISQDVLDIPSSSQACMSSIWRMAQTQGP